MLKEAVILPKSKNVNFKFHVRKFGKKTTHKFFYSTWIFSFFSKGAIQIS